MTAVDGAGVRAVVAAPRADDAPERSRFGSWALAARLARREVRRRPGRTLLVVLLIAIPVAAMTVGSVGYRTTRDSAGAHAVRTYGQADGMAWLSPEGGVEPLPDLPEGTGVVPYHEVWGWISTAEGRKASVLFTDLPAADPITTGMVLLREGRFPQGDDEVALAPKVARELGVGVGDTLHLSTPAASYGVVGLVRSAAWLNTPMVVVGAFDFASLQPQVANARALLDLPDGVSTERLPRDLVAYRFEDRYDGPGVDHGALAWGWVGGALALVVMGIVIAAAFASSARRQLVTLGQLSANGASHGLLRRMLALQGLWSGVAGAAIGVVLGLALVLPQHGLLERIANHSIGGMQVSAADLAVIAVTGIVAATIAAFVPARTASRVPTLSALAGRAPLGKVPAMFVPVGGVLAGGGVALVAMGSVIGQNGAHGNLSAGVIVLGGVAVLGGVCCLSPAIVAVFGRVAERVAGTPRLAARSLARTRTRSAAVVAAIAAAGALSVGGATAVGSERTVDEGVQGYSLPPNMAVVTSYGPYEEPGPPTVVDGVAYAEDYPMQRFPPLPADTEQRLLEIVPDGEVVPVRVAAFDPGPEPVSGDGDGDGLPGWYQPVITVADPALLDTLGLAAPDREALARVGVLSDARVLGYGQVVTDPAQPRDVVHVRARAQSGPFEFDTAVSGPLPSSVAGGWSALITPERAAELGFTVSTASALLVAPDELTDAQRREIRSEFSNADDPFTPAPVVDRASSVLVNLGSRPADGVSDRLVDALIIAGALLFTLAVVAVGLALSAAETRDERDVLVAVGASPRSVRGVSAIKASLLAVVGGVLAVPAGFVPVAAAIAQERDGAVRFPWLVALGVLVAIPAIVGLAALAGSAVAQRVRPVTMSTLTTD